MTGDSILQVCIYFTVGSCRWHADWDESLEKRVKIENSCLAKNYTCFKIKIRVFVSVLQSSHVLVFVLYALVS
jgi:hypothetical protein